jgi:hypothetical protein
MANKCSEYWLQRDPSEPDDKDTNGQGYHCSWVYPDILRDTDFAVLELKESHAEKRL